MKKRRDMDDLPNLCMFCGKDEIFGPMNKEDFVPKCLWEKGHRPPNVQTVPAHESCNSGFSKDNEYVRDVLAMEEGVTQKCDAGAFVNGGAIKRKFQHRFGSVVNTLKNLQMRPVTTSSGLIVGCHPSFEVDWARIDRVLLNVMKGIFFVVDKRPMPNDFLSCVQDVRNMNLRPYEHLISDMVPWQTFGDDCFMCRYRFVRRPDTVRMNCLMQFYRSRCFFGETISPRFSKHLAEKMFVTSKTSSEVLVPNWIA